MPPTESEEFVVYDKAKWHYEGDFPTDLPESQAFVLPGMFLAWATARNLLSEEWQEEGADELGRLEARKLTPGRFFQIVAGTLASDMLSKTGNAFAVAYYQSSEYYTDAAAVLGEGLSSLYQVADSWENFEKLEPILDKRFQAWTHRR